MEAVESEQLQVDILPTAMDEDTHCNNHNNSSESLSDNNLADGTLSPTSLRRSTRVSALNAQKKLKLKDVSGEMVKSQPSVSPRDAATNDIIYAPTKTSAASGGALSGAKASAVSAKRKLLKRKLSGGMELDQYDCKFGIRLDAHGDVFLMSDESEVSSLDEEQVADLRKRYEMSRRLDVTDEVKEQRAAQIRELDVLLRLEEGKLAILKKIRLNQQQNHFKNDNTKKITSSVGQNTGGNAYKPAIATPPVNHNNAKLNGANNNKPNNKNMVNRASNLPLMDLKNPHYQQIINTILTKSGASPAQIAQMMKLLGPAALLGQNQPQQAPNKQQQNLGQQQQRNSSTQQQSAASTSAQQQQAALIAQQKQQQQQQANAAIAAAAAEAKSQAAAAEALAAKVLEVQHINAQRIAAARSQLRKHMEHHLLQLPTPKPPTPVLHFIPNANQPDFYAMLGLDLVVQRVRKDKTVFKKWESELYVCEQCGTDFTPAWEAIEDSNGDHHLYCKQCVRQAQKRKVRNDHNNLYKCVFAKMKEQEKEFERQVAAGKFSEPIPTTIPVTNTTTTVSASTASQSSSATTPSSTSNRNSAIPQQQNSGNNVTTSAHYHGTGSGPVISTQQQQQHHFSQQQQSQSNVRVTPQPSSGSSTPQRGAPNVTKAKRTAVSSNGTTSSNSQPTMNNQAMLNALRNHPMFSAILSSPMMAQNFLNQIMTNRVPQNTNSGPASMASLLQAFQSSQSQSSPQQQQNNTSSSSNRNHQHLHSNSHTSGSSGGNNNNSSGGSSGGGINPMWALNTQLNASALLNNPQLLRQLHQAQIAQQMFAATSKTSKK